MIAFENEGRSPDRERHNTSDDKGWTKGGTTLVLAGEQILSVLHKFYRKMWRKDIN